MSGTADSRQSSGGSAKPILGVAAAACVACCFGPILAVLGGIAALGFISAIFIGAAGLLIAAATIAAFVFVRRRRRLKPACSATSEPTRLELTRRRL